MKENPPPSTAAPEINFLSGPMQYRLQRATLRNELIARAIGASPRENPKIVDATAGLGRDSFILASLGYHVTMLERVAVIHDALRDALQQAQSELPEVVARLHLIHADAIDWLSHLQDDERPDVIYLDPMFPKRKKSASVKKNMVIMQDLVGNDSDYETLFKIALSMARKRVIVKRAKLADKIGEKAANFALNAKTSRFDIYLK